MALFCFLTLLFPILGIVLGIMDLTYDGKRKNQGGVLLALGVGMSAFYGWLLVVG